MKKHNQLGFGIVPVLIIFVVLAVVGFAAIRVLGSNGSEFGENDSSKTTQDNTRVPSDSAIDGDVLELQNLGLESLEDNVVTQDALREYATNGLKGFYVFGDMLSGGRLNPNLEFASVRPDTDIVAAVDGEIVFVRSQGDSDDYEVFLQTSQSSAWMIGYDHLTEVTVKQGDKVRAGDALGKAAVQGNGLHRFEFQVNKKVSASEDIHYCPVSLLAGSVKQAVTDQLKQLMAEWEALGGNALYDELKNTETPGCYVDTLTPAQAEGR